MFGFSNSKAVCKSQVLHLCGKGKLTQVKNDLTWREVFFLLFAVELPAEGQPGGEGLSGGPQSACGRGSVWTQGLEFPLAYRCLVGAVALRGQALLATYKSPQKSRSAFYQNPD